MSQATQRFFDNYNQKEIQFSVNDVDVLVGYFQKRGFDEVAAVNTASVILYQAAIDNINVMKLMDTLKGVSDVQLNSIIATILNINRRKTSQIGIKEEFVGDQYEKRNIIR